MRFALRTALTPSGDYERILTVLREAETLADTLDDPQRRRQDSLLMTAHFYITGDPEQAIAARTYFTLVA